MMKHHFHNGHNQSQNIKTSSTMISSSAILSAMPPQVQVIHSNISSLNHTLGTVRSQLSTHLESELDTINNIEAQYDMFVERCKKDKAAVEAGLMDIHSAIERVKAVQENTKIEMNRVDQRIKELKMTKQSEVPSTHGLDMTKLALETKITKLLEKKRRFLARRQATVEEIRKHLRMFAILGLKFKQGSGAGCIVLEFSNLKHASDAKALCEIRATGDNSFTLIRAEPKIKDAELLLQQSQDLREFVKKIRERFVKAI